MRIRLLILLLIVAITSSAQFQADNLKYKTVFPQDLCKTLQANPGYIILDVRSQGEFDDTLASSQSLNIGHIKGAMHIDIRQLPQRWKELEPYKDHPIFVYCSHSQRSRRASRLLADSGFTKLFNVNGGLTNFYDQGIEADPCNGFEIQTALPYKILPAKQLSMQSRQASPYYIIDLRTDSAFNGISSREKTNAEGRFEDAVNIPFEELKQQNSPKIPSKPVLLVDESGDLSPQAARWLLSKGYKDISILFDGMEGWNDYLAVAVEKPGLKFKKFVGFGLVSASSLQKMMAAKKELFLIDVRTKEEFNNESKNPWENIGNIRGAVNIPSLELGKNSSLPAKKSTPIVIYGFGSKPEIFESAKWLADQGYNNIMVLQNGIWNIRWAAHNISEEAGLADMVTNVPASSQ